MIRSISISLVMLAVLAVMAGNAVAETLVERGNYLVNTILACGNCHTPKNATGAAIAEKELAGGLSFTTPAFSVTAANITPDRETRHEPPRRCCAGFCAEAPLDSTAP